MEQYVEHTGLVARIASVVGVIVGGMSLGVRHRAMRTGQRPTAHRHEGKRAVFSRAAAANYQPYHADFPN